MSIPGPEPSEIIETTACLDAKKIRFEINKFLLPNSMEGEFGIIRHPGAALAVPITDSGEVVILRQYRFACSRRILEFPAGTLELGESPLESIKREVQEESGYSAKRWDKLGEMLPCPGYSDETIHIFLARDLTKLEKKPEGDADEDIEVLKISPRKLNEIIASGEESLDGKTITAWFRACQLLNMR
jgi:ADP-ribose pyrophosphatase